jgi:4-carboxymuconolactone decarboxylase
MARCDVRLKPDATHARLFSFLRSTDMMRVAIAAWLAAAMAVPTFAQERLPPIPPERMTEAQKKAVEEFRAARNAEVGGPFAPLLRSPEVMNRARAMGDYLRFKSVLPPRLSEFAILITARQWTQNYEWDTHNRIALQAGLSQEIVGALADGRRPERMAEDEDILYSFCTELQRQQSVSDGTYARAVGKFGEQGVIDMIGISGYYTLLAMVLNTARTPVPAGRQPALAPFPH